MQRENQTPAIRETLAAENFFLEALDALVGFDVPIVLILVHNGVHRLVTFELGQRVGGALEFISDVPTDEANCGDASAIKDLAERQAVFQLKSFPLIMRRTSLVVGFSTALKSVRCISKLLPLHSPWNH